MKNSLNGTPLLYFFLPQALPSLWPEGLAAHCYQAIVIDVSEKNTATGALDERPIDIEMIYELFHDAKKVEDFDKKQTVLTRTFRAGVSHPMAQSLSTVIALHESKIRIDQLIVLSESPQTLAGTESLISVDVFKRLEAGWREPAIEDLYLESMGQWLDRNSALPKSIKREDDSFAIKNPSDIGLEFSTEEWTAIEAEATLRGRAFNRAELELIAQTWSEHCKHKIFAAQIKAQDVLNENTSGLFKTHIRNPTFEIAASDATKRLLSVFHDNAGVLALQTEDGEETSWAMALKMETHNSPSAISPYGGASTGIVGVHRDILGTGLGAMPIANWDVLCFENPNHDEARPANALPADVVRLGVIKGIEDGGNQSGIATVQGSVVFAPGFAVKPFVFAGSVGLLPKKFVDKKTKPGLKLYCLGGAVGADGLRGAVMSSRDLRQSDFIGSAVQVANAFVQRRMTDFLLEARDLGLIEGLTDNGAGGLASSCGEMAGLSGGAQMELGQLRLKYEGLLAWERLLSESQERMTVATSQADKLEALAKKWEVDFDVLGELNASGRFHVTYNGKDLVNLRLKFLHEGCPQMQLQSDWTLQQERSHLEKQRLRRLAPQLPNVLGDYARMLESEHLCSRKGIVRRFDHEVQGRSLRKSFQGSTQNAPSDSSLIDLPEVYEAFFEDNQENGLVGKSQVACVLAHGLAPWRSDIVENVLHSFDEAMRGAILGGIRMQSAGALDNFCWPDPIPSPANPRGERHLWRLVRANEVLSDLCRGFSIPLISGKDSMKNNSKDFECPATLVMSIGGSARNIQNIPVSFFARANEVVFLLPPLRMTLRDSIWERIFGALSESNGMAAAMFGSRSAQEFHQDLGELIHILQLRYQALESLIAQGHIRAAKDIGEGGMLTSVFEMSLGRDLGFQFEAMDPEPLTLFGEGLGGFVLAVDPHCAREVEMALPEIKRLGVVMRPPMFRWGRGYEVALAEWKQAYLKKTEEGFFG